MNWETTYAYIRHLSLDVVAGSICSGAMVVHLLQVDMPWVWWVSLPVGVWLIYTADHLLDAERLGESAHTDRHRFHYKFSKRIKVLWLLILGICLFIIPWYSPKELLVAGLFLVGLVGIHLLLVNLIGSKVSIFFQKELGVGVIYSLGVWLGPVVIHQQSPDAGLMIMSAQFSFLAFINLIIFSHYDRKVDELDGSSSLVRAISEKRLDQLIIGCSMFVSLASFFQIVQGHSLKIQLVYLLMLGVLLATYFFPNLFEKNERFRSLGDGVFIFPILTLL
ncbi:MAG: hypothetical protein AAGC85_10880 [Bacteroidota bacterium]